MKYLPHIIVAAITLYMIRWAYKDIQNENRPEVTDDDIIDAMCNAYEDL